MRATKMDHNLRAMQASPAAQLSPQHLLTVSWQPATSPQPDESSSNYLKIGLGVGLGVPFLILICAYIARYYKATRRARESLPRYCSDVRPPTPPLRSDEQPRSPTIRNRLTPNGSRRSLEEIAEEGLNSPSAFIDVSGAPHFETPRLILPTYMSDQNDL